MRSAIGLRGYQLRAADAVEADWAAGVRRTAVILPTGGGKTVVFSELVRRWRERRMGRALVLAHREELIEQGAAKLRLMVPELRVGIVKAGRDNVTADAVVGSVQTLRSERRRERIRNVGLVVVDECHHATAATYRMILEHYGCFADGAVAVGFTATMTRSDDARLGDIWQNVAFVMNIKELMAEGERDKTEYLSPARGVHVHVADLDLRKVRQQRGDYSESALGAAIEGSLAPQAVARAYREHGPKRQGVLFAPTVSSAEAYGDALAAEGFKSELVHGMMTIGARRDALERFRQGDTQILANCMVLTEGTDLPMIQTVVVGRPTKSQGLWIQMVGRGLRPWPGKADCLVLDVVGASRKNSLNASVDLFGDALEDLDAEEKAERPDGEEDLFELDLPDGASVGDGVEDQVYLDGELTSKVVDLFHGSDSMWLRTYGGVWFLPCPERFIVLKQQDNGMWGVVWCDKGEWNSVRGSGWIARDVPDLSWAMAHAEANVSTSERLTTQRERSWRRRPATEKAKRYAHRLGIILRSPVPTGGEVSEAITMTLASKRIDPFLGKR